MTLFVGQSVSESIRSPSRRALVLGGGGGGGIVCGREQASEWAFLHLLSSFLACYREALIRAEGGDRHTDPEHSLDKNPPKQATQPSQATPKTEGRLDLTGDDDTWLCMQWVRPDRHRQTNRRTDRQTDINVRVISLLPFLANLKSTECLGLAGTGRGE